MDPQHQVREGNDTAELVKMLLFSGAAPLTRVRLWRVQIGCQRRPFLRNASCQEEAHLAEEEGGTALSFLQHIPQLLPAQNTSGP